MTEKTVRFQVTTPPGSEPYDLGPLKNKLCKPDTTQETRAEAEAGCDTFTINDLVAPYLQGTPVLRARLFEIALQFTDKVSVDNNSETETLHIIDDPEEWKNLERATLQMDLALVADFAAVSSDINSWERASPELVSALVRVSDLAFGSLDKLEDFRAARLMLDDDNITKDLRSFIKKGGKDIAHPDEMIRAADVFPKINFTHLSAPPVVSHLLDTGPFHRLVGSLAKGLLVYEKTLDLYPFHADDLLFRVPTAMWGDIPKAFIALASKAPDRVDLPILHHGVDLADKEAARDILWPYFYGEKPAPIIEHVLERDDYRQEEWGNILKDAVNNGHPYAQGVLYSLVAPKQKIPTGKRDWQKIYSQDLQPFFYKAFNAVFHKHEQSDLKSVNAFETKIKDRLAIMIFQDSDAYTGSFISLMITADFREFDRLVESKNPKKLPDRDNLQLDALKAFVHHPACVLKTLAALDNMDGSITFSLVMLAKQGHAEVLDFLKGLINEGGIMTGFALEVIRKILFDNDDHGIVKTDTEKFTQIQREAMRYLKEDISENTLINYLKAYESEYADLVSKHGEKITLQFGVVSKTYHLYPRPTHDYMQNGNQILFDSLLLWGRRDQTEENNEYSFDSLYKAYVAAARSKYLSHAVVSTMGGLDEKGYYSEFVKNGTDPLSLLTEIFFKKLSSQEDDMSGMALADIRSNFESLSALTDRENDFTRHAETLKTIFESPQPVTAFARIDIVDTLLRQAGHSIVANLLALLDTTALYNELTASLPEGTSEKYHQEIAASAWSKIGKLASYNNEKAFDCLKKGLRNGDADAIAALQTLMTDDQEGFGAKVLAICLGVLTENLAPDDNTAKMVIDLIQKGVELGISAAWEGLWQLYSEENTFWKVQAFSADALVTTGHYLEELDADMTQKISYYLEQGFTLSPDWFTVYRPVVQGLADKDFPDSYDLFLSLAESLGINLDGGHQDAGLTGDSPAGGSTPNDAHIESDYKQSQNEEQIHQTHPADTFGNRSYTDNNGVDFTAPKSGMGRITIPNGFTGRIRMLEDGTVVIEEGDPAAADALTWDAARESARVSQYIEALVDVALNETSDPAKKYKAIDNLKLLCLFAPHEGVQALQSIAALSKDEGVAEYAVIVFVRLSDGSLDPQGFLDEIAAEQSSMTAMNTAQIATPLKLIRQMLLDYIAYCKETVLESNEECAREALQTIKDNTEDPVVKSALGA
ncbi:MAG: hypothetical protein HQM16_10295 [Deltaproteobacteria bacterium]|nr:hypothetical protein [Deltaproteobacteria bacterium]